MSSGKGAARIDDTVTSKTGTGDQCKNPVAGLKITDANTANVYANGRLIVVEGNKVPVHNKAGCTPDTSVLTSFSSSVKIGGKGAGRIGDKYTEDNEITSGSSDVLIGG